MTRRQEIITLLEKEERSAQDLANHFRMELKFIVEDLLHIKRSIKPRKMVILPAQCKGCGFIFKERSKIKRPSRCPKCKHERIQESLFRIQ